MHKNKINNKVYIGKSTNVMNRWQGNGKEYKGCTYFYNAIKKYGWNNFEHIILEDNLSSLEEMNKKECYYIEKFDSRNPEKGYNLAKGGLGGLDKGINNPNNISIICLETKKIYPSAQIASEELNIDESCIRKACRGDRDSAGGYHWENYNKYKNYDNISISPARGVGNTRPVKCIETGEIFKSCVEAAKKIGSSSSLIGRCCRGTQKTIRGLHFCYEEVSI